MFNKIEKYVYYRAVLDLISKEEVYDRKRNTLNGEEIFKLCHERYRLMHELLLPIKEKLNKTIEVTNIYFVEGLQQETNLIVEYQSEGKKAYFAISNYEFDSIEQLFGTNNKEIKDLIDKNKDGFLEAFKLGDKYSFDQKILISTTSKKFLINDDLDKYTLTDSYMGSILSLSGDHNDYEKTGILLLSKDRNSNYKKVDSLLNSKDKEDILLHTRVYEDEIPKILIKK